MCIIILSAAPALSQTCGIIVEELLSPRLHTQSHFPCKHEPRAELVAGELLQSWRLAELPLSGMAGTA